MTKTNAKMSEDQAINLVRNSLLVAGEEMGTDGDHWPVIKSTVHNLMRDWENIKIERNLDAELKIHLYAQLKEMENGLPACTAEARAQIEPKLKELHEVYDAYFSSIDEKNVIMSDEHTPIYLKRAEAIIDTLGGQDE